MQLIPSISYTFILRNFRGVKTPLIGKREMWSHFFQTDRCFHSFTTAVTKTRIASSPVKENFSFSKKHKFVILRKYKSVIARKHKFVISTSLSNSLWQRNRTAPHSFFAPGRSSSQAGRGNTTILTLRRGGLRNDSLKAILRLGTLPAQQYHRAAPWEQPRSQRYPQKWSARDEPALHVAKSRKY